MDKIVPLYVDYSDKVWQELLKKSPQTVIINPADGPGPNNWSDREEWSKLVNKLLSAKWKVLYYIDVQSTEYKNGKWVLTRKTEKQLLDEKSIYDSYPKASGYFLDDYPSNDFFPEIVSLEKTLSGTICVNPGGVPSKKVIDVTKANIIVLHETDGFPSKKPLTPKKSCAIVFGQDNDKPLIDQKWDYGVVYKNKESSNPFKILPINI